MAKLIGKEFRQSLARIAHCHLASKSFDESVLIEGLETIIAYHLLGDEGFCEVPDLNAYIKANRTTINPLVQEAIQRGGRMAR